MVRLKAEKGIVANQTHVSFNSKMVRLKDAARWNARLR